MSDPLKGTSKTFAESKGDAKPSEQTPKLDDSLSKTPKGEKKKVTMSPLSKSTPETKGGGKTSEQTPKLNDSLSKTPESAKKKVTKSPLAGTSKSTPETKGDAETSEQAPDLDDSLTPKVTKKKVKKGAVKRLTTRLELLIPRLQTTAKTVHELTIEMDNIIRTEQDSSLKIDVTARKLLRLTNVLADASSHLSAATAKVANVSHYCNTCVIRRQKELDTRELMETKSNWGVRVKFAVQFSPPVSDYNSSVKNVLLCFYFNLGICLQCCSQLPILDLYARLLILAPVCAMEIDDGIAYAWFIKTEAIVTMKNRAIAMAEAESAMAVVTEFARFTFHYLEEKPLSRVNTHPTRKEENGRKAAVPIKLSPKLLRLIFDQPDLDVVDLCSLADVCPKFGEIAHNTIRRRFQGNTYDNKCVDKNRNLLCRLYAYVTWCGYDWQSLHFEPSKLESQAVMYALFLKHCTRVRRLQLDVCADDNFVLMAPLLQQVESLQVDCMPNDDLTAILFLEGFFPEKSALRELTINGDGFQLCLPECYQKELKVVKIFDAQLLNMNEFHAINPQIEKVTFDHTRTDVAMFKDAPNLKELRILGGCFFTFDADPAADCRMINLHTLVLDIRKQNKDISYLNKIAGRLDANVECDPSFVHGTPNLSTVVIDKHVQCSLFQVLMHLSRMPNIRRLAILDAATTDDFAELLKDIPLRLRKLETLYVSAMAVTIAGIKSVLENAGSNIKKLIFRTSRKNYNSTEIRKIGSIAAKKKIQMNIGVFSDEVMWLIDFARVLFEFSQSTCANLFS